MNMTSFYIDAIGWSGAALVLVAYGLISIDWVQSNSFSYQALNVTGALLLVINSYYLGAYPSVGVNAAWVGIAAITLFHDWWRGPAEAYKKVSSRLLKRKPLRRASLLRVKLPAFRRNDSRARNNQPSPNNAG